MKQQLTLLLFSFLVLGVFAQKDVTTVGIQIKPIIPVQFSTMADVEVQENNMQVNYAQKLGNTFGVVIRRGFTDKFAIETGIGFVRRNYTVTLTEFNDGYTESADFGFIGYELPVQVLYYVQMSERIFLNTAAGLSLDMFPSDVEAFKNNLVHFSYRYAWVRPSMIANVGAEYRSKKQGYFYVGLSYHRPFKPIIVNQTTYAKIGQLDKTIQSTLNGHYLTLDFRYFFNEPPEKKQVKRR
jgi:hypothetical protein